jgi:hypothetical protein
MSGIFDPTERFLDWDEATRQDQDALRSRIWTAMPVIIGRHIPDKMTVEAQPSVQLAVLQQTGELQWHSIPSAPDMPLLYLGGGGAVMTIPVQQGDEGLAVYASRSIDNWWQNGGVQPQSHTRTHSLSDSFVIPGFRSQKRKLANISTNTWQLRTEDGKTNLDFDPTKGQFTFNSPSQPVVIKGDLQVTGEVTAKSDGSAVHLSTHVHTGVQSGQANTGPPQGGSLAAEALVTRVDDLEARLRRLEETIR